MPGFALHTNAQVQCFHAAPAMTAPTSGVLVSGQAIATAANQIVVALCPFTIPPPTGPKPQPCATIRWTNVAARVTVYGQPVLLQATPGPGAGICQSAEQIPQGVPKVGGLQTRVKAT